MNKVIEINGPKVGLFSDIHIGLGQDSSVWHKNVLEFAEWTSNFYKEKSITDIFIPGDIFHNRNEISVNTLNISKQFFDYFKDFRLFISSGNHDCYYKDRSDVNSISLLSGWKNIVLIDKTPEVFKIKNSKKVVSFIPWGVSVADMPKSDICLGHFEIQFFKMNTHKVCDHGFNSSNLLAKSPFIISGHFHHRDHRTYNEGQILYVGSPYQQNFGDVDSERGIYILDVESDKFEFFKNEISPKHYKISLNCILKGDLKTTQLKKIIPNNMISLVIDTACPTEKLNLLVSKLQSLKPKFFRMQYESLENSISSNNLNVNCNAVDIPKSLQDFVDALEISNKQETIDYLKDLYHKIAV